MLEPRWFSKFVKSCNSVGKVVRVSMKRKLVGALEESPLFEAVTRKRLLKTKTEKTACAVVICKVRSAIAP
jgi:hypothetical protein